MNTISFELRIVAWDGNKQLTVEEVINSIRNALEQQKFLTTQGRSLECGSENIPLVTITKIPDVPQSVNPELYKIKVNRNK